LEEPHKLREQTERNSGERVLEAIGRTEGGQTRDASWASRSRWEDYPKLVRPVRRL